MTGLASWSASLMRTIQNRSLEKVLIRQPTETETAMLSGARAIILLPLLHGVAYRIVSKENPADRSQYYVKVPPFWRNIDNVSLF